MTKDPHEIMEACRDFYADLYKEEPVDQEAINDFLYDINLPRVPPDLVKSCEGPLTYAEAKEVIVWNIVHHIMILQKGSLIGSYKNLIYRC